MTVPAPSSVYSSSASLSAEKEVKACLDERCALMPMAVVNNEIALSMPMLKVNSPLALTTALYICSKEPLKLWT